MTKLSRTDRGLMIGLSRVTNDLQRQVCVLCGQHDLTQTQFAILEALYSKGDLLVGEIQRLILSTPGNVPFVINNLLKKGLVRKLNVESDKRCSRISLTEAGKQRMEAILPCHDQLLTEKFAVLSPEEKAQLLTLVHTFWTGLKGDDQS